MTKPTTSTRERSPQAVLAIVLPLALFIALAVWTDLRKDMWTDESFSLSTSGHRSLVDTIHRATRFELQPPFYFLLLNLWLRINAHIEFGRILSLLCAAGSVIVVWLTGMRLRLRRPILLLWLTVLTPGVLWAASEMRVYGLVLLFTALANLFFVTLVFTDDSRPVRTSVAYGAAILGCLLTSYYTGFALLGHWISVLLARRRRVAITAPLVIVGVLLAPFLPTVLAQTKAHPAIPGIASFTFRQRLFQTLTTWLESILTETSELGRSHAHGIAIAVLVAPVLVWIVAWARRATRDRPSGIVPTTVPAVVILGVMVLVPTVILGLLRLTNVTLVNPRHMVLAIPGLLLWLTFAIDQLAWPRAAFLVSAALAGLFVYCLGAYESIGWQVADWRVAARYVAQHGDSTAPVLLAPSYESAPFEYYYPWPRSVVPVPGPARLDTADNVNTTIRDSTQLASVLSRVRAASPFWLVTSERPTVAQFGREKLERYVTAHYRVLADTQVHNVSMRRLVAR